MTFSRKFRDITRKNVMRKASFRENRVVVTGTKTFAGHRERIRLIRGPPLPSEMS